MSGRKRNGGGGGHQGGDERWLLTYADMITLLLALFIVLFAMSSIDAKQFDHVRRSLSQTFKGQVLESPGSVLDGSSGIANPEAANQSPDNSAVMSRRQASNAQSKAWAQEQDKLKETLEGSGLSKSAKVTPTSRGIVISLAGDALFDPGDDRLRPEMERKLNGIVRELRAFGRPIAIEGHTDRSPISTAKFPDNMMLSAWRAHTVWRYFLERDMPRSKMEVRGFGDIRPKVESPDLDVAANRRIEIVVLAPGADDAGTIDGKDPEIPGADPSPGRPSVDPVPSFVDPLVAVS